MGASQDHEQSTTAGHGSLPMPTLAAPITRHVLRHYCPFCFRGGQSKACVWRHVNRCFKNPASRSCKTCALWEPGERSDFISGYPGCPESCGAGVQITTRMPLGCPHWESAQ